MLQVIFPGMGSGAVAAAAVSQDQQFIAFAIGGPAATFPPVRDRIDRKRWCLVARSNSHEATVCLSIVDAIRDRHPDRVVREIVIIYHIGFLLPRAARILEIPDLLLFLGIYADDGIPCDDELLTFTVDVFELPVAHLSWRRIFVAGLEFLVIDAQREPHFLQKTPDRLGTDPDVQFS